MDFDLTSDQEMLQQSVQRLLERTYDFERSKGYLESPSGWSGALWQQYAELGSMAMYATMISGHADAAQRRQAMSAAKSYVGRAGRSSASKPFSCMAGSASPWNAPSAITIDTRP